MNIAQANTINNVHSSHLNKHISNKSTKSSKINNYNSISSKKLSKSKITKRQISKEKSHTYAYNNTYNQNNQIKNINQQKIVHNKKFNNNIKSKTNMPTSFRDKNHYYQNNSLQNTLKRFKNLIHQQNSHNQDINKQTQTKIQQIELSKSKSKSKDKIGSISAKKTINLQNFINNSIQESQQSTKNINQNILKIKKNKNKSKSKSIQKIKEKSILITTCKLSKSKSSKIKKAKSTLLLNQKLTKSSIEQNQTLKKQKSNKNINKSKGKKNIKVQIQTKNYLEDNFDQTLQSEDKQTSKSKLISIFKKDKNKFSKKLSDLFNEQNQKDSTKKFKSKIKKQKKQQLKQGFNLSPKRYAINSQNLINQNVQQIKLSSKIDIKRNDRQNIQQSIQKAQLNKQHLQSQKQKNNCFFEQKFYRKSQILLKSQQSEQFDEKFKLQAFQGKNYQQKSYDSLQIQNQQQNFLNFDFNTPGNSRKIQFYKKDSLKKIYFQNNNFKDQCISNINEYRNEFVGKIFKDQQIKWLQLKKDLIEFQNNKSDISMQAIIQKVTNHCQSIKNLKINQNNQKKKQYERVEKELKLNIKQKQSFEKGFNFSTYIPQNEIGNDFHRDLIKQSESIMNKQKICEKQQNTSQKSSENRYYPAFQRSQNNIHNYNALEQLSKVIKNQQKGYYLENENNINSKIVKQQITRKYQRAILSYDQAPFQIKAILKKKFWNSTKSPKRIQDDDFSFKKKLQEQQLLQKQKSQCQSISRQISQKKLLQDMEMMNFLADNLSNSKKNLLKNQNKKLKQFNQNYQNEKSLQQIELSTKQNNQTSDIKTAKSNDLSKLKTKNLSQNFESSKQDLNQNKRSNQFFSKRLPSRNTQCSENTQKQQQNQGQLNFPKNNQSHQKQIIFKKQIDKQNNQLQKDHLSSQSAQQKILSQKQQLKQTKKQQHYDKNEELIQQHILTSLIDQTIQEFLRFNIHFIRHLINFQNQNNLKTLENINNQLYNQNIQQQDSNDNIEIAQSQQEIQEEFFKARTKRRRGQYVKHDSISQSQDNYNNIKDNDNNNNNFDYKNILFHFNQFQSSINQPKQLQKKIAPINKSNQFILDIQQELLKFVMNYQSDYIHFQDNKNLNQNLNTQQQSKQQEIFKLQQRQSKFNDIQAIFRNHQFQKKIMKPLGIKSLQLLKLMRKIESQSILSQFNFNFNNQNSNENLFNHHTQQTFSDTQFQASQHQQIISLNHINDFLEVSHKRFFHKQPQTNSYQLCFNQAIFDLVNFFLDDLRPFGKKGAPLIYFNNQNKKFKLPQSDKIIKHVLEKSNEALMIKLGILSFGQSQQETIQKVKKQFQLFNQQCSRQLQQQWKSINHYQFELMFILMGQIQRQILHKQLQQISDFIFRKSLI